MSYRHSFVLPLGNKTGSSPTPTVTPELAPTGTITDVAKASHVDGETVTIQDGSGNPAVVFEYDVAGDGVSGTNVPVDISAATDAASVAAILNTAIQGQITLGTLAVTSSVASNVVTITDVGGAATAHDITETVADAGYVVTGLTSPTGSATWTYKLVALDALGNHAAVGSAGSTTAGAASLDSQGFNRITWTDAVGAVSYDIYRTAHGTAPTTLGKIGNVLQGVQTFDDTGLAGNGATAPTSDITGISQAIPAARWLHWTTYVSGFTSGTWKVQVSGDDLSSTPTNWVDAATTVTNSGFVDSQLLMNFVRVVVVTYVSGTPVCRIISQVNRAG